MKQNVFSRMVFFFKKKPLVNAMRNSAYTSCVITGHFLALTEKCTLFCISIQSLLGSLEQQQTPVSYTYGISSNIQDVIFFVIILICIVFGPFCKCICQCFMFRYFFLMLQGKEQQSHSLQVILTYLIFVTTTFRLDVFKDYNFLFYLRINE